MNIVPKHAFDALLLSAAPLIDVRAPQEYLEGHLPDSVNLPLLDDDERAQVGTCYKQQGQESAIALGNSLVSGQRRAARIARWQEFASQNPAAVITCFRGGLRSRISQSWLKEAGIDLPRIEGGYKALRTHLIEATTRVAASKSLLILSGKTGMGKTHLINRLSNSIDLEGLANHRGSAFGRRVDPQPAQAVFENRLALELIRREREDSPTLFLEDESRAIGSIALPLDLHREMANAKIAHVDASLDYRVETILNDYIVSNYEDYKKHSSASAMERFSDSLLSSLERIRKRLGGERYAEIDALMRRALAANNDLDQHRAWIRRLLVEYYDPMYEYQLNKKSHRVVFRGSRDSFLEWAAALDRAPAAER